MDSLREIHEQSAYYDFMHIDPRAYHEKIKYFERNKSAIQALDDRLETEVWYHYTQATFEIGDYRKHVKLSSPLLERIIHENILKINGTNAFEQALFNKGASHFNLKEYKQSEYIFGELVKMNPSNKIYTKAFLQNRFSEKIKDTLAIKLFTVVMLLTIISISLIHALVLNPFYPYLANVAATIRDMFTILLFGVILLNTGFHYIMAKKTLRQKLLHKKT